MIHSTKAVRSSDDHKASQIVIIVESESFASVVMLLYIHRGSENALWIYVVVGTRFLSPREIWHFLRLRALASREQREN